MLLHLRVRRPALRCHQGGLSVQTVERERRSVSCIFTCCGCLCLILRPACQRALAEDSANKENCDAGTIIGSVTAKKARTERRVQPPPAAVGNESAPGVTLTLKTGKPTAARSPPGVLQPVAAGLSQPNSSRDRDVRIRLYGTLIYLY